jgi:DNA modification methylase
MIKEIYNNDCQDILGKLQAESIDGVFTDPPFNIDLQPQRKTHGKIANDALDPIEFATLITTVFTEIERVVKPDSVVWVCCNWECINTFEQILKNLKFTIPTWIVWAKNNWGIGWHFRPQHEFILPAFKGNPPVPEHAISNLWQVDRITHTIHPNEKPIQLIQMALKQYNKPGDVILDPFAGSFSTCLAAKNLGMGYIGIEKTAHEFEKGRKRLEEGMYEIYNAKGTRIERNEGNPLIDEI